MFLGGIGRICFLSNTDMCSISLSGSMLQVLTILLIVYGLKRMSTTVRYGGHNSGAVVWFEVRWVFAVLIMSYQQCTGKKVGSSPVH